MDKEPNFFDNTSKIFKKLLKAGLLLSAIGFSPKITEGQNTPEAQKLRAESEQIIIEQIENKKLGMAGTMGGVPIREWENDGKILTIGYDNQDGARWLIISQGDNLVFVDRDLDGNFDRVVVDQEDEGRVGLADDMINAFGDINKIAQNAPVRASLLPVNKIVMDINGTVVKLVSFKTGEVSQNSVGDDSVKGIIAYFQITFGIFLRHIREAIERTESK